MIFSPQLTSTFDAICTAIAAACAVYVAMRDSRWRKSGLAKQLQESIAAAHDAARNWDESDAARKLRADVDAHARQLASHSATLEGVATKADIIRLEGVAKATETKTEHTAAVVDRIEGILLKKALG